MVDVATDPGIAFCIVTYRELFYESSTYRSLIYSLEISAIENYTIYIYDNTDTRDWQPNYDHLVNRNRIRYYRNPANPGISAAYNFVAGAARDDGFSWIVFLDQDSDLAPEAVTCYREAIRVHPEILIKAPIVRAVDLILSPSRIVLKRCIPLKKVVPGIRSLRQLTLINSGMMVNVPFFFMVGGYDPALRLDFTDHQFIARAKRHAEMADILPFVNSQRFSHENDDLKKAATRYSIFLKDLHSCKREGLSDSFGYFLVDILHLLKLSLKFRSFIFVRINLNEKLKGANSRESYE